MGRFVCWWLPVLGVLLAGAASKEPESVCTLVRKHFIADELSAERFEMYHRLDTLINVTLEDLRRWPLSHKSHAEIAALKDVATFLLEEHEGFKKLDIGLKRELDALSQRMRRRSFRTNGGKPERYLFLLTLLFDHYRLEAEKNKQIVESALEFYRQFGRICRETVTMLTPDFSSFRLIQFVSEWKELDVGNNQKRVQTELRPVIEQICSDEVDEL